MFKLSKKKIFKRDSVVFNLIKSEQILFQHEGQFFATILTYKHDKFSLACCILNQSTVRFNIQKSPHKNILELLIIVGVFSLLKI